MGTKVHNPSCTLATWLKTDFWRTSSSSPLLLKAHQYVWLLIDWLLTDQLIRTFSSWPQHQVSCIFLRKTFAVKTCHFCLSYHFRNLFTLSNKPTVKPLSNLWMVLFVFDLCKHLRVYNTQPHRCRKYSYRQHMGFVGFLKWKCILDLQRTANCIKRIYF